jgi:NADH:ubiquinone oxidoreductase subunit E
MTQKSEAGMKQRLTELLAPYQGERGVLIPVLQQVQGEFGYISEQAVSEIARFLAVSQSEIYGVATFYAQFRFTRPGEHMIKVCQGTACHVRGGARIMETVERELGINPGETTEDYKFSLERVACFGCCALSPVMVVDDTVYSRMTPAKAKHIVASY